MIFKKFFGKQTRLHFIYIIILLFLCLFSAWINRLPPGHIISAGDFAADYISIKKNISENFYVWGRSTGSGALQTQNLSTILQKLSFYALDYEGISDTNKQNIKYFLFLFLSGLFTYISLGLFSKGRAAPLTRFIVAVFYSFNSFTLNAAARSAIYSIYWDIYIFLPLIWSLFVQGVIDKNLRYLILSGIVILLAVGGASNPGFLASLLIFLILTILFLWSFKLIGFKQVLLSFLTVIGFFLLISFHILPYIYEIFGNGYAIGAMKGNVKEWVKSVGFGSLPVSYPFRLEFTGPGTLSDFFPYIFLPRKLYSVLAFYPAGFVALSFLLYNRKIKNNAVWMITFGGIYLIYIFGASKVTISETLSLFIFSQPILEGLRSFDKFFLFLPFLYSFFLAFFLEGVTSLNLKENFKKAVCYVTLFIILIYPVPMFFGKFHQTFRMNYIWENKFNTMVKMPGYYKQIASYVNSDHDTYKILSMPYSGTIGIGWVLYPTWKYIGVDYTTRYFNNPVFSPVANISGQFGSAEYLHQNPREGRNIFIDLIRIRGIRYLIVNKDVASEYLQSFRLLFKNIKKDFIFIKTFGNLELYRIKPEKELPVIYPVVASESRDKSFDNDGGGYPIILQSDVRDLDYVAGTPYLKGKPVVFFSEILKNKKQKFILKTMNPISLPSIQKAKKNISEKKSNKVLAGSKDSYALRISTTGRYHVQVKKNSFLGRSNNLKVILRDKVIKANPADSRPDNNWINVGTVMLEKGHYPLKIQTGNLKVYAIRSGDLIFAGDKDYDFKFSPPKIHFRKTNPTKYVVNVSGAEGPYHLVFSESFHRGWKAYIREANGRRSAVWETWFKKPLPEAKHFLVNGYANDWYVEPRDAGQRRSYQIILEFWPQRLFYLGSGISGLTLITCLGYLVFYWARGKSRKKFMIKEEL